MLSRVLKDRLVHVIGLNMLLLSVGCTPLSLWAAKLTLKSSEDRYTLCVYMYVYIVFLISPVLRKSRISLDHFMI